MSLVKRPRDDQTVFPGADSVLALASVEHASKRPLRVFFVPRAVCPIKEIIVHAHEVGQVFGDGIEVWQRDAGFPCRDKPSSCPFEQRKSQRPFGVAQDFAGGRLRDVKQFGDTSERTHYITMIAWKNSI